MFLYIVVVLVKLIMFHSFSMCFSMCEQKSSLYFSLSRIMIARVDHMKGCISMKLTHSFQQYISGWNNLV